MSGFGLAPNYIEGSYASITGVSNMGVSSGAWAGTTGTYSHRPEKVHINTKELVLDWIMTYGESPVKLDAFIKHNHKFAYIDDKYLDVNEDTQEYALNEFAKALLVE